MEKFIIYLLGVTAAKTTFLLDDPQHKKTFLLDDGSLVVVTKMSIDRIVRRNTRQGEVFCLRQ
jgi:hypothetical protein